MYVFIYIYVYIYIYIYIYIYVAPEKIQNVNSPTFSTSRRLRRLY